MTTPFPTPPSPVPDLPTTPGTDLPTHPGTDPIPNPEPPSPSLPDPDPGVFHHDVTSSSHGPVAYKQPISPLV